MIEEEGEERKDAGRKLERRDEGKDGFRYYLANAPLHAGDLLEMEWDDGGWQRVRFEWSYDLQDAPQLFFPNGAGAIALSQTHRFRRPK